MDTTFTQRALSTRLGRFVVVSIILHFCFAIGAICPYVYKEYREHQRLLAERQAREEARKRAEQEVKKAAQVAAREKIVEVLRKDAHDLLSENLTEAEFDTMWADILNQMDVDINGLVEQLQDANFDLLPENLAELVEQLRSDELRKLLETLSDKVKNEIVAKILDQVKLSIPEFKAKVEEALAKEGDKAKAAIEQLLKQQEQQRQADRAAATQKLDQAAKELAAAQAADQALQQAARNGEAELARQRSARETAGQALNQALAALREAKADTTSLQGLAAAAAAHPEALPETGAKGDPATATAAREKADQALRDATQNLAAATAATDKLGDPAVNKATVDAGARAVAAAGQLTKAGEALAGGERKLGEAATAATQAGNELQTAATALRQAEGALTAAGKQEKDAGRRGALEEARTQVAKAADGLHAAGEHSTDAGNVARQAADRADVAAQAANQEAAAKPGAAAAARAGEAVARAQEAVTEAAKQAAAGKQDKAAQGLEAAGTAMQKGPATLVQQAAADVAKQPGAAATAADQAAKQLATLGQTVAAQQKALGEASAKATDPAAKEALTAAAAGAAKAVTELKTAEAEAQQVAAAARRTAEVAKERAGVLARAQGEVLRQEHQQAATAAGEAKDALATATRDPAMATSAKPRMLLTEVLTRTDQTLGGEFRRVADAVRKNDPAGTAAAAGKATEAIDRLIKYMEEARGQLGFGDGEPGALVAKDLNAARQAAGQAHGALAKTQKLLNDAAATSEKAGENKVGDAVRKTGDDMRQTDTTTLAAADRALDEQAAKETALGKGPPQLGDQRLAERLNNAEKNAAKAGEELTQAAAHLAAHRQDLAAGGKDFAEEAGEAVAKAVSKNGLPRQETNAFVEQQLKEQVAADYRQRAEQLAAAALKQKGYAEDGDFVRRVGDLTMNTLLSGTADELKSKAFDKVAGAAAAALAKKKKKKEGPEGGAEGPEGPEGENEAEGEGGGGAQTAAAQALNNAVGGKLKDAAKGGVAAAMAAGKQSLSLPGPEAFGGEDPLGIKLGAAVANSGRELHVGGRDMVLISLQRDLGTIGQATGSGYQRFRLFRGQEENPKAYQEHVAEVIEGRDVDELLLKAPPAEGTTAAAAAALGKQRNAVILVSEEKKTEAVDATKAKPEEQPPPPRKLYQPRFKSFAYGGAPLALTAPVIDGDLSEWKDVEEFHLRGLEKKSCWPGPVPPAWENNRFLMVQWTANGFYFAYRMNDEKDNIDCDHRAFWANDCLEVFFDFANKRPANRTRDTQQFWLWPVGSRLGLKIIGGEAIMSEAQGIAYLPRFQADGDETEPQMAIKRTTEPRGYQVEVFLPVEVFTKPDLKPGRIIAFNFSINNGREMYFRWTNNLGRNVSEAPSLWGDLVLLGTDAEAAFVKPGTETPLTVIIPGEPIGVRVRDLDMNLDPGVKDRLEITLRAHNGDSVTGLLEETGHETGVFVGSVDTELLLLQGEERFKDQRLQVTGGEEIQAVYLDQARRYGERNFEVIQKLPVGVPVLQLSSR